MKTYNEEKESCEWEGKDYCLSMIGLGILIFCLCIGIGGCINLGNKGIAEVNKSEISQSNTN